MNFLDTKVIESLSHIYHVHCIHNMHYWHLLSLLIYLFNKVILRTKTQAIQSDLRACLAKVGCLDVCSDEAW